MRKLLSTIAVLLGIMIIGFAIGLNPTAERRRQEQAIENNRPIPPNPRQSSDQSDLRKAWLTMTIQLEDGSGAIPVGTKVELLSRDGSDVHIRHAGREIIVGSSAVTVNAAEAAAAQSNAAAEAEAAAVAQFNAAVAQQQQGAAAQAARAQKTRIQGFVSRKTNDGLIVELSVRGGVSHNADDVPMGINNPIGGPGWNGSNRVFLRGCSDQENLR
jgi:hypothetical protein